MGILKCHIELILDFKSKNPNSFLGNTLTFGQQAIYMEMRSYQNKIMSNGISPRTFPKNFDYKCKIPSWLGTPQEKYINANTFFYLLGSDKTVSLDYSKYENSEMIFDLNKRIPKKYENKFNTIIDIGTSEHIFNIPQVLENVFIALRTNGHYIFSLPVSNSIDHGFFSFSPGFFYDYFSINNFKILDSYLIERSPYFYESSFNIFKYKPGPEMSMISSKFVETFFVVKKIKKSSFDKIPYQNIYQNNLWKKDKTNKQIINKDSSMQFLKNLIKNFFLNKFTPHFIHKFLFKFIRGKNIRKL